MIYGSKGFAALATASAVGLITKATTLSGPERIKTWQEAMKIVHEDMVADVFLFQLVYCARVGKRIVFAPTSATNSKIPLEQIAFK